MDIAALVAEKRSQAEANISPLAPELAELHAALPTLQVKTSKEGGQFLALNLTFEGSEVLSPFFGLAYAMRELPEDQLLAAEEEGLFQKVRTKVSSWERGAITVSFFPAEEKTEAPAKEEAPKSKHNNRGR